MACRGHHLDIIADKDSSHFCHRDQHFDIVGQFSVPRSP